MRFAIGGIVALSGVVAVVACGDSNDSGGSGDGSSGSTSSGNGGSSGAGSSSGGSSGGSSSGSGSSSGGVAGPGTSYAGCTIFPKDNPWNQDISGAAIDNDLMTSIMPGMALDTGLHPDWGTFTENYGIPITTGASANPAAIITFHTKYGPGESDKLACTSGGGEYCYPIPLDAKIEGGTGAKQGSDRHVLFLDTDGSPDKCTLYELYNTYNPAAGGYSVGSAAIWHLDSNALRTEGWTSADAAGLPIMPGLVRRDEIVKGEITHTIRFTMDASQNGYIHPATHAAGTADTSLPPMGLRVRLKASFNETGYSGPTLTIIKAMKKYGMILADNGSNWYISGQTEDGWAPDMDDLVTNLAKVKGSDFEIVKTGTITPQPP